MLKELFRRHRALRLGASLVGASALAIGFASPALAAGTVQTPTGGTDTSVNYNIIQGGSNTTYLMMTQMANLFNESPGCDLAAVSGQPQPLDLGCPGLGTEPGSSSLSHQVTTAFTGAPVSGSKKVVFTSTTNLLTGMTVVSDTGHALPVGDVITKINTTTDKVKFSEPATASDATDTITILTTPAVGENGFTTWGAENPFNDVLVEQPATGSSNGIQQLEDQGSHGPGATSGTTPVPIGVSPLDAARSSRAPKVGTGDDSGLNFVAYAQDGVDWMCWTQVAGSSTPCAHLGGSNDYNLSTTQLKEVYNGTLDANCPAGITVTTFTGDKAADQDWACLTDNNADQFPIATYIAQNGSGTESTWVSTLGLPSSGFPYGGEDANHIIFENETASILAQNDESDAIFFFSFGKFKTLCGLANISSTDSGTNAPTNTLCSGATDNTIQLGDMNVSGGAIPVNQTTIASQLPGGTGTPFPGDRLLYNVYSDGSNTVSADGQSIPASSDAALNAISEDGFMCKPSTKSDVDPNTGATYLSEIQSVIKSQGFFPLPLEVENGQGDTTSPYSTTHAGIPNPAWNLLDTSNYAASVEAAAPWSFPAANQDTDVSAVVAPTSGYTGVYDDGATVTAVNGTPGAGQVQISAANPVGYCLTLSTDGNTQH